MSDLMRLTSLLYEFGILYKQEKVEPGEFHDESLKDITHAVVVDQGIGYSDFVAEFYFDKDGNFIRHGVWE